MPDHTIITLLTDFGLKDVYVGVMKGVIAQINPSLTVVDLTHEIPPQDIGAARFCLMNAYSYFPVGTVHLVVVDPGVGSQRRGIALQTDTGFFVGPDNGLFSGVLHQTQVRVAVELTNTNYWRTPTPSTTFHGRDIFAPVSAHLASGVSIEQLGEKIDPKTLTSPSLLQPTSTASGIVGYVQYVDHFGNIITNIPGSEVQGKAWSIVVKDCMIERCQTYSDCELGGFLALIGSHGWVEIAVNGGNAQSKLQLDWETKVQVLFN